MGLPKSYSDLYRVCRGNITIEWHFPITTQICQITNERQGRNGSNIFFLKTK